MSSNIIKNKIIVKNTGILYLRMFFSMAVSLYTSRIVLKTLGIVDFGLYNVVGSVITSFLFFSSALSASTQRFLTFELGKGNETKLKQLFGATLNLHIVISIIILILAETIGLWFIYNQLNIPPERFIASLWIYQFTVFSAVISIIQVPYNISIISHEKMGVYAYFSMIEVTSILLLVYLLTLIEFDKLILYAVLVFSLKVLITYAYKFYCKKKFKECTYQFYYNKKLYKELMSYSGWNLFGNLSIVAKNQGVNILLNLFFGPAINASRAIAFQIQNAANSLVQNIQTSTKPQIIKSYASNDKKYMLKLIFASAKFSYFFTFLIVLPILFETKYVLNLWLVDVPEYTEIFTFLILINILIECVSGSLMTAFHATGKIKVYQVIVGVLVLMNLPLSYLFLKLNYTPEITIYISIVLSIVAFFSRLQLLKTLINISFLSFFNNVLSKLLIITVLSVIIPLFVFSIFEYGLQRFLLISTSSLISVLVSVYLFGLNNQEKEFIFNNIKLK